MERMIDGKRLPLAELSQVGAQDTEDKGGNKYTQTNKTKAKQ